MTSTSAHHCNGCDAEIFSIHLLSQVQITRLPYISRQLLQTKQRRYTAIAASVEPLAKLQLQRWTFVLTPPVGLQGT
jgi:hypothetical protein